MLDSRNDLEQWGTLNGNVLFPGFWYKPMSGGIQRKWGIGWSDMVVIVKKGSRLTAWWDRKALENEGILGIKKYLLKPRHLIELLTSYENSRDRLLELNQRALSTRYEDFNPKLGVLWYKADVEFWYDATVFEIINYGATPFLRSKIEKHVPAEKIDQVLAALLAPEKMSFHKKSEIELLKTVANGGDMNAYARKWYWVDNSYLDSKHITAREFRERVKGVSKKQALSKIGETKEYFQNVLRKKREIVKQYHLPKNTLKLARILSWSVWIQDERKGVYWEAITGIEKLCRLAGKKYGISYKDMTCYWAEAWHDLMAKGKKIPQGKMKQIKANILFDTGLNRYNVLYGKKAELAARKFFERDKHQKPQVLKGLPVSPGKVKGKVKILNSPQNLNKLKPGDILVSPFTSPDFVVAMRKAKAIITDVGGLVSHAAVVSRELGIPCIVGTKFATKILKDGDFIEVDATKGTVKILKQ